MTMLEQADGDRKLALKRMDKVFLSLYKAAAGRNGTSVSAARTLLAWGVGMPTQMVKIQQSLDMNITATPDVDSPDLKGSDNVTINEGKKDA